MRLETDRHSIHQRYRFFPRIALRCAVISLCVVLVALFAVDRIALPLLEKRGLTSGGDWIKHNELLTIEHRKKDTSSAPRKTNDGKVDSQPSPRFGVRSWTGHTVAPKKTAACRILVMGDSFVWGSPYLTLNHMWWRQLEMELRSRGYDVEVIASGQPGASTRDQLEAARAIIPEYTPDLIVWGYVTNDPDVGLVKQISWSQQSLPGMNRLKNAAARIWPRLIAKFDSLRSYKLAKAYAGPEYGYEYGEWELKLVEPDNLSVYQTTVRGVKDLMVEHKLPGFMITLPNYPSTKHFAPRLDPVLSLWRDTGLFVHDALPAFVAKYGEFDDTGSATLQWGINPADGHPGPKACRFLAIQAADVIERIHPSQLGARDKLKTSRVEINDWIPAREASEQPQKIGSASWKMTYPEESRCPSMPLGEPTALVSFRDPVAIEKITFRGEGVQSAHVWVSYTERAEGDDIGQWIDLGTTKGHLEFTDIDKHSRVYAICFRLIMDPMQSREFTLEIEPNARGQM